VAVLDREAVVKGVATLVSDPVEFGRKLHRLLRPMRRDYRRRFQMRLREWLLYHHREVVFTQSRWLGVPAQKNPCDAWIYQELLHEVRPDVVVEIGGCEGGGTLFLAGMLDLLGHGQVVSVDIDRSRFQARHPRIVEVTGPSAAPPVVARVRELCAGKRAVVIQDADHRKEGVLADLRAYWDLVPVGSYFIVEDGLVDLFTPGDGLATYGEGPLAAIEAFLAERPEFEVDASRERYLITYNPRGFLRRVR